MVGYGPHIVFDHDYDIAAEVGGRTALGPHNAVVVFVVVVVVVVVATPGSAHPNSSDSNLDQRLRSPRPNALWRWGLYRCIFYHG